ncbi:IS21 family transposase [Succinivibrio sp.]|uniref:IS21 family transposase n=1 Tax=Succinivibrio sp. TaxID=2053619 RepID=UPI0025D47CCD|nr:IS21 family transposase [Succinivibrio sp.]MBQ9221852.1 IS21 family transposase [Succinivibrio sp.]
MVDYREILRLHSLGNSNRQISEATRSSHHTITDVINAAEEKNIVWPLNEDMTNRKLRGILFPEKLQKRQSAEYFEPDYGYIHKELARPGVTLSTLWNEYCTQANLAGTKPYMTTQFRDNYRKWALIKNATMRIKHKPGDVMEVDWAGNTIPIYDADTGDEDKAYLFVAVLPFSGYAYVEACFNMKSENWILCHMHAYEYFGGVTRLLVPDNLKTGVTKHTQNEIALNKSYQEMAEHYGTAIIPTRVKAPKDKANVESTVKLTYTRILAPLRNRKFFSIKEANDAIKEQLKIMNSTPFQKREGTRESVFLTEEKGFLRPLPISQFEPAIWLKATVGTDYLVSDGKNKYSVPFDLIGEEVQVRLTKNNIDVYFKGTIVASHIRRTRVQRDPIIFEEHMTPEHRKYLRYNADDFRMWAKNIGPNTEKVIEYFLAKEQEPEQGYRSCASLSRLGDRYGAIKLENACTRMLNISSNPSVRNISSLLKNYVESDELKSSDVRKETGGGITRGASAFAIGGSKR